MLNLENGRWLGLVHFRVRAIEEVNLNESKIDGALFNEFEYSQAQLYIGNSLI